MPFVAYNNNTFAITELGGYCVRMTNRTGAASAKGDFVEASTNYDDAVEIIAADEPDPVGVVYSDGVADGSEIWIVIHGPAEICLEDQTASTHGYWCKISDTDNGRADVTAAAPGGGTINALEDHMTETGHCIQSVAAGGAGVRVLARAFVHFN
jgi:hypothetical protein